MLSWNYECIIVLSLRTLVEFEGQSWELLWNSSVFGQRKEESIDKISSIEYVWSLRLPFVHRKDSSIQSQSLTYQVLHRLFTKSS